MRNSFFQFKQFTVQQDKTAMKICTDSCLFGAWCAIHFQDKNKPATRILDVGTGTGLLSLMLAQKTEARIDAVEIDDEAAAQATDNFLQSPWKGRLHVYKQPIQEFSREHRYDFIIANPPFYNNDLSSKIKSKNIAHHNAGLALHELLIAVKRVLHEKGKFTILLPYHRTNECKLLANEEGYFLNEQVLVKQTVNHFYFRSLNLFSKDTTSFIKKEMAIKDENGNYTNEFVFLLKDYYLHL